MANGDINFTLGKLVEGVETLNKKVDELDIKVDKLVTWKANMQGRIAAYSCVIAFVTSLVGVGLGRLLFF